MTLESALALSYSCALITPGYCVGFDAHSQAEELIHGNEASQG
jgi:hypothetical protein